VRCPQLAHECADGDLVTVPDAASSSKSVIALPLPHVVSACVEAKAFASQKRRAAPDSDRTKALANAQA
jgi:hypothetical protein